MKGHYPHKPRKLHREVLTEYSGMLKVDVMAELGCSKSALLAAIKREKIQHLFPNRSQVQRLWRYGYCGKP